MSVSVTERIARFPAVIVIDASRFDIEPHPTRRLAYVVPGQMGYVDCEVPDFSNSSFEEAEGFICAHFKCRNATPEEREAAIAGSMFGWHVPAADPSRYER